MNALDIAFMPALAQAALLRRGDLSPLELVHVYLERIAALNPQLGSYWVVAAEQAIAEAQAKTEQLVQHRQQNTLADLPPLFGLSISVKDLNPVAGLPCSYGVAALRNQVATGDDGVMGRVKAQGLVILGKTATSQLGSFPYTEPQGFPPTRNPWNLDYTPGGSSGGAAASLAAGLCSLAQGSDGGGSIRGPAFCCGLVGIKPSRGRISNAPLSDVMGGYGTQGVLGRTVSDAAALLDALAGYVPGDSVWLSDPEPSFQAIAQAPPDTHPKLKIAIAATVPPFPPADPACQAALDTVQTQLIALGHTVIDRPFPDIAALVAPFTVVWRSMVAAAGVPREALEPMNQWLFDHQDSAATYLRSLSGLQLLTRSILAAFQDIDVWVLPTYLHPAIRVSEWAELPPEQVMERIAQWIGPCPVFNVTGQPAIALPTGLSPEGLPVGVQLVGHPAAEGTLIGLAAQLEACLGWQASPIWAGKDA